MFIRLLFRSTGEVQKHILSITALFINHNSSADLKTTIFFSVQLFSPMPTIKSAGDQTQIRILYGRYQSCPSAGMQEFRISNGETNPRFKNQNTRSTISGSQLQCRNVAFQKKSDSHKTYFYSTDSDLPVFFKKTHLWLFYSFDLSV